MTNMTKKFCGALSAALAIVLTLSACGGKTQPAASSQRADGSVSSSASSASQSGRRREYPAARCQPAGPVSAA